MRTRDEVIEAYLDGCNAILVPGPKGSVIVSCPEDDYKFKSLDEAVEMMRETIAIWESEV